MEKFSPCLLSRSLQFRGEDEKGNTWEQYSGIQGAQVLPEQKGQTTHPD